MKRKNRGIRATNNREDEQNFVLEGVSENREDKALYTYTVS
jgi:hypothetical protein